MGTYALGFKNHYRIQRDVIATLPGTTNPTAAWTRYCTLMVTKKHPDREKRHEKHSWCSFHLLAGRCTCIYIYIYIYIQVKYCMYQTKSSTVVLAIAVLFAPSFILGALRLMWRCRIGWRHTLGGNGGRSNGGRSNGGLGVTHGSKQETLSGNTKWAKHLPIEI